MPRFLAVALLDGAYGGEKNNNLIIMMMMKNEKAVLDYRGATGALF